MRNYDEEIDELNKELRKLDLDRTYKELQLQQVLRDKQESKEKRKPVVVLRDKIGKIISVGDWVKVMKSGKFTSTEGRVVKFKSWVTFEDVTKVKQVRAPYNLLVCKHD